MLLLSNRIIGGIVKTSIKNPTDPLHYFFSSVNNKVEIHLKCRLATTLAKSKFDIFDTGKKHSFSFPQKDFVFSGQPTNSKSYVFKRHT